MASRSAARLAPRELARRLRLVVVTDRRLAQAAAPHAQHARAVEDAVAAALAAGATAIQLRDKELPPRDLVPVARRLRAATRAAGALLFVNDRVDVAVAVHADGVHLGPHDLPVAAARRIAPPHLLVGHSTDDPRAARRAEADGADYIGCGAVYATATKADAGLPVELRRLAQVAQAVRVPVLGIGGVTPSRAPDVRAAGAAGCAAVSAVMGAPDPGATVRSFLRAMEERDG